MEAFCLKKANPRGSAARTPRLLRAMDVPAELWPAAARKLESRVIEDGQSELYVPMAPHHLQAKVDRIKSEHAREQQQLHKARTRDRARQRDRMEQRLRTREASLEKQKSKAEVRKRILNGVLLRVRSARAFRRSISEHRPADDDA